MHIDVEPYVRSRTRSAYSKSFSSRGWSWRQLARYISVRRPGVTNGLHILEGERLIRSTRGAIEIVERPALEAFAGTFYGRAEDAWFRMLAKPPRLSQAAE